MEVNRVIGQVFCCVNKHQLAQVARVLHWHDMSSSQRELEVSGVCRQSHVCALVEVVAASNSNFVVDVAPQAFREEEVSLILSNVGTLH